VIMAGGRGKSEARGGDALRIPYEEQKTGKKRGWTLGTWKRERGGIR